MNFVGPDIFVERSGAKKTQKKKENSKKKTASFFFFLFKLSFSESGKKVKKKQTNDGNSEQTEIWKQIFATLGAPRQLRPTNDDGEKVMPKDEISEMCGVMMVRESRRRMTLAALIGDNKFKVLFALPLVVWLALFQLSILLPTSLRPEIDVETLPELERALFGSTFVHRMLPRFDGLIVLAAIPYLCHFMLPWVFALYLWWNRANPLLFFWCLGLLNLCALITQLVWATAPPWYVEMAGTAVPTYDTPSDPGRLIRVDKILQISLFESMYGQNPVVFGSFPSLHGAWPFLISLYTPSHLLGNWKWLYVLWIWWAAIYLKHHFLVDLLGGAFYTLVPYYISKLLLTKEFGIDWDTAADLRRARRELDKTPDVVV